MIVGSVAVRAKTLLLISNRFNEIFLAMSDDSSTKVARPGRS